MIQAFATIFWKRIFRPQRKKTISRKQHIINDDVISSTCVYKLTKKK